MDEQTGRHESRDRWAKLREKARKQLDDVPTESMLEVRPASHWIIPVSQRKTRAELYTRLWSEGEVAILFGEKGVGKSFFAVQLAEDIATGRRTLSSLDASCQRPKSRDRPRVLYLDFEHSAEQFTTRYTYQSPVPGKPPRRVRFHFTRAAVSSEIEVPAQFKRNLHNYLQHSIITAIEQSAARVVIIDNLSYMTRGHGTAGAAVIKTLKLWAAIHNLSILAIAHAPRSQARIQKPEFSGTSVRHSPPVPQHYSPLTALADTVFALNRSTYGPEYRYIKHLESRSTPIHPEADVLTYSLAAMDNGQRIMNNASENSQLSILNSQFPPTPFAGLNYLGPSAELDHLRDYHAEALAAGRLHTQELHRLKHRTPRQALVEGVLDGTYARYLNP